MKYKKGFKYLTKGKRLPAKEEIDEAVEAYGFVVPYNGTNDFYDAVRIKHFKAGIDFISNYIDKQDSVSIINNELPSVEIAGAIAVKISENIQPALTAQEQAFFVAGFQECIKWLSSQND